MSDHVLVRLDRVVDEFCRRTRFFNEPMTKSRARSFVRQHRQNTRFRNSVLKLKVATNCPDWETRLQIIGACAQEIIADHEHGHGKAHWQILEELGVHIGMTLDEIRTAVPLDSTVVAWSAWEGLMANRHWLEGIVANTCAERANVPGYGTGTMRDYGWFGLERERWGSCSGSAPNSSIFSNCTSRRISNIRIWVGRPSRDLLASCTWTMPSWKLAGGICWSGSSIWTESPRPVIGWKARRVNPPARLLN